MAESKIRITELEFQNIKDNLKNFIKSKPEFTDYDFEGAGLNILMDILAYNTHYMSYYTNMIANEMFMDTADLRSSVVSHAKLLGYMPRSRVAPIARVNVQVTPGVGESNQNLLLIPRFTRFRSENINGTNFTFVLLEDKTLEKTNGKFTLPNAVIKQGVPLIYTFVVDDLTNPQQKFKLPDTGIDTSTIEVTIQKSATNLQTEKFVLAEDASVVEATSPVYYVDEVDNGKYQIYFGDNVLGKKLEDGNLVVISYLITDGPLSNKANTFSLIDSLDGFSNVSVTTAQSASAGADIETIDIILFSAPKAYLSQNRAVTKNDYIALINKKYPYFDSVTVWGGEELVPPQYGRVFISAKPRDGFEITEVEKNFLKEEILKPISILTVTPEFIDADYNYLNFGVRATYDPLRTNKTPPQIESAIKVAITTFINQELNKFNSTFRASRLTRKIDDSDPAILSNELNIFIQKKFKPFLNNRRSYTLDFGIPLARGTTENRLYSSPGFEIADTSNVIRTCFIEEVPFSYSGIDTVEILDPGTGYTETPTVEIIGDGTGATAQPVVVNGRIRSINVIKRGSEYTNAVARISGGGSEARGASAKVVIQGKTGNLRMYYFDDNQIKVFVNESIGTIDYTTGKVTISELAILDVLNDFKQLSIHAKPENTVFESNQNKILTLNYDDPESISVRLTPISK
jgi:hypothetical protein